MVTLLAGTSTASVAASMHDLIALYPMPRRASTVCLIWRD
jgi:hypothetical protein